MYDPIRWQRRASKPGSMIDRRVDPLTDSAFFTHDASIRSLIVCSDITAMTDTALQSHEDASRVSRTDEAAFAVIRRSHGRTLRKSCDRCHQQKLKCVGDKTLMTRCRRCQRGGLECVFGARSSKAADKCNINLEGWSMQGATDSLESWTNTADDFDAMWGFEPASLDNIFADSPTSLPAMAGDITALAESVGLEALTEPFASSDRVCSANALPHVPASPQMAVGGTGIDNKDPLPELYQAFESLESTYVRLVEEWTSQDSLECTL